MKTQLEFKGDDRLHLSFEIASETFQPTQRRALIERITDVNISPNRIPVTLMTRHELDFIDKFGNSGFISPLSILGYVKSLVYINPPVMLADKGEWLMAKIDLYRTEETIKRLAYRALLNPAKLDSVSRPDFVVIPRMQVSTVAEPTRGRGGLIRQRFQSYGPIQTLDCVHGFIKKERFKSS